MGAIKEINHFELIEGVKEVRDQYIAKIDVLDKVKELVMLPDEKYVDSREIAKYYEVEIDTIRQVRNRHKDELNSDGAITLSGDEFKQYRNKIALQGVTLLAKANVTLFTRRSVLRVGMLLTDSPVAEKVRTYLLNVEEQVTQEQKESTIQLTGWDKTKDELLLNTVVAFANTGKTLTQAFEHISNITGVTKNQVQGRWYQGGVRTRCDENTLNIIKNMKRNVDHKNEVIEMTPKEFNSVSQDINIMDIDKLISQKLLQQLNTMNEEYKSKEMDWTVKYHEMRKELKLKNKEYEFLQKSLEQLQQTVKALNIALNSKDVIISDKDKRISRLSKDLVSAKQRMEAIEACLQRPSIIKQTGKGTTVTKPKKSFKMDQNGNLTEVK